MEHIFLKLLNMSITASWLVLAILVLRLLLQKAPKSIWCVMWALVGIRLICPYSFESGLSLIPSAEPISQEMIYSEELLPQDNLLNENRLSQDSIFSDGLLSQNNVSSENTLSQDSVLSEESLSSNNLFSESLLSPDNIFSNGLLSQNNTFIENTLPQDNLFHESSQAQDTANSGLPASQEDISGLNHTVTPTVSATDSISLSAILSAASVVWIIGMVIMSIYTLICYLRIYRKIREGVEFTDKIWLCDRVTVPFIFGLFHPRIFLPSSMNEADVEYVIAHEKAHLKRGDHLWKPLGFVLLTVYWFNPLMWLAYILLCRDIELACDEKVIRELGVAIKKSYSEALINCSVPRRMIAACPLAFGETSVKRRIQTVLHYKKPAFWMIGVTVAACMVVSVCFFTNPVTSSGKEHDEGINGETTVKKGYTIVNGAGAGENLQIPAWLDPDALETIALTDLADNKQQEIDKVLDFYNDNLFFKEVLDFDVPAEIGKYQVTYVDSFQDHWDTLSNQYIPADLYAESKVITDSNYLPYGPTFDDAASGLHISVGCTGFFTFTEKTSELIADAVYYSNCMNRARTYYLGSSYTDDVYPLQNGEVSISEAVATANAFVSNFTQLTDYPQELKPITAVAYEDENKNHVLGVRFAHMYKGLPIQSMPENCINGSHNMTGMPASVAYSDEAGNINTFTTQYAFADYRTIETYDSIISPQNAVYLLSERIFEQNRYDVAGMELVYCPELVTSENCTDSYSDAVYELSPYWAIYIDLTPGREIYGLVNCVTGEVEFVNNNIGG